MILAILIGLGLLGIGAVIKNKQQAAQGTTYSSFLASRDSRPDYHPTAQHVKTVSNLIEGGPFVYNPVSKKGAAAGGTGSGAGGTGSGGVGGGSPVGTGGVGGGHGRILL